jgi:hypothetical protein
MPPGAVATAAGDDGGMLTVALARRLHDAGLRWDPASGDRFVIPNRDLDDMVFVLSDMTIEVHQFPTGPVIGFNGTVEWALDSLEQRDAVWLPREDQLRDRLGGAFRRLERDADRYTVVLDVAGREARAVADDPEEAYGRALLHLITGEDVSDVGSAGGAGVGRRG